MKLVAEIGDRAELEGARLLLESKGVPVFVGNEAGARNMGFVSPARQQSLWVVFDEQLDDALALLEDAEHEVAEPVDMAAYDREVQAAQAGARNRIFGMVMAVGVITVLAAGALIYVLASTGP